MVSEKDLKEIISQVLKEMGTENKIREKEAEQTESDLQDITKIDLRDVIELKNPANKAELMKYKKKTPARIGISRAGTRYTTNTMLRFRADHASAVDAVYTDVSEEFLNANNLFTVQTKCHSKDEYMTRPDLGRRLNEESINILKEKAKKSPKVEIFVSDGLSSTAIEANVEDTLPAIINGLKSYGIEAGTPFFLKYGRVGAADEVSEILDAEVTCVLIGERPGLATSESMSAYITYKGYMGIPESKRTVVSNIHKNGTPASEAGAHIAHIIKKILDAKASGQDLKL
ncbi:ethanolamine ammonia-lyase subunit EutC [Fusobacterium ulcerans]|nr:ethanolamine ammonia-lyase subunit EutC [uncultured Fusobacterium sp.]BBA52875.1 ethanolamine ammonia-lyase light chain [Fusobacterium varium]